MRLVRKVAVLFAGDDVGAEPGEGLLGGGRRRAVFRDRLGEELQAVGRRPSANSWK